MNWHMYYPDITQKLFYIDWYSHFSQRLQIVLKLGSTHPLLLLDHLS